jgi:hypothetical protein
MAQEVPKAFADGSWATSKMLDLVLNWSYAFNDSVPTGNGSSTSNHIYAMANMLDPDEIRFATLEASNALAGVISGCPNHCRTKIRAPALAVLECTSHKIAVDYNDFGQVGIKQLTDEHAPPTHQILFGVSVGLIENVNERMYVFTQYYQGEKCVGYLNRTACTLESAIGEYDIVVKEGIATLTDPGHPTIIDIANNTVVDYSYDASKIGYMSTLAAVVVQAYNIWDNVVAMYTMGPDTPSPGVPSFQAFGDGFEAYELPTGIGNDSCSPFRDPTADVLRSLNTMMVYAGAVSASSTPEYKAAYQAGMDPNLPMHYTVEGELMGDRPIYSTEFRFFGAAALVELVCIAAILPMYWGFWTLGRPVSFSPLELAR